MTGGDNNLALVLGKYDPGGGSVQCGRREDGLGSCRDIVANMDVDARIKFFGPEEDPQADVKLPYSLTNGKPFFCNGLLFLRA